MVFTMADQREKCEGCGRNILTHHRVSSCDSCSKLFLSKCSNKVWRYKSVNNVFTCQICISNIKYRYNPFASLYATTSHANHEPVTDDSDIQKLMIY